MHTPSTTVERTLPEGEHGNTHHNVPESRCGSNEENNLSTVVISRHNDFHGVASNALVTELIRQIALHSTGLENPKHRLDASQVRKIFGMTSAQDWQQYYWPDAVVSGAGTNAPLRSLQNLRSTANFLAQEKVWANDTVATIRGEDAMFPTEKHLLLDHATELFDVQTPAQAIERLLTEKHNGELSWCKPLKHNVRNGLLDVLKDREGIPLESRKEYVQVMLDHHKVLDVHAREIERTLTRTEAEIRKMLRMMVLRPDDSDAAA